MIEVKSFGRSWGEAEIGIYGDPGCFRCAHTLVEGPSRDTPNRFAIVLDSNHIVGFDLSFAGCFPEQGIGIVIVKCPKCSQLTCWYAEASSKPLQEAYRAWLEEIVRKECGGENKER